MRGTRRGVLLQLENWLNSTQSRPVLWLNGLAGTGKSTIAQTFAEMSFADGRLGASFFCLWNNDSRSNLQAIFPTLAFQLAQKYPLFQRELSPVLKASPNIEQETLHAQMEKLIVHPFEKTQIQTLIIVDALDECQDEQPISTLLSVLSCYLHRIPFIKFFITARPEAHIQSGFHLELLWPSTDVLRLHEVNHSSVDSDIRLFLKDELVTVAKDRSDCNLLEEWPSMADLDILCEKAAGLFIYASIIVKLVASRDCQPAERLTNITTLPQSTVRVGWSGIDQLYTNVLQQAFFNIWAGNGKSHSHFRSVVGTAVLSFNPLSVTTLSDILGASDVFTVLHSLHPLLVIPTSQPDSAPIHILHESFLSFLTDPHRCTDERFFINSSIYHQNIALLCLRLMKRELKKNICQPDDYAHLNEVGDLPAQRKNYIGDALQYACCFWARHLMETRSDNPDIEEVHKAINEFFTSCFLFWIEVLSLMQNLEVGTHALNNIHQWYMMVSYKGLIITCKY